MTTNRLSVVVDMILEINPDLARKTSINESTTFREIHFDSLSIIRLITIMNERNLIDIDDDFSGLTCVGHICNIIDKSK
jgi:acyl carrier protein